MPSVANMSISPGAIGCTTGWSRGSSDPTIPPRVTRLARAGPRRAAPSPESSRPSTLPTPHSINARPPTDTLGIHASPFFHRHGGPLADVRAHVEVVHQAPRTREPQSQAARRRVAVLERARHVPDPRALIARDDHDALTVAVRHQAERDFAPFGVHEDVARDLGDRRGDHRLVAAREPR